MRWMTLPASLGAGLALFMTSLAAAPPGVTDPPPSTDPPVEAPAKGPEPRAKNLRGLMPRYPTAQLRKGISGYVLVQFRLDEDGIPQDPRVVMEQPKGTFASAVLQRLRRAKFEVPPEWVARNPGRLHELGYVFLVERCLEKDVFPGIEAVVIEVWRRRSDGERCHGEFYRSP